MDATTVLSAASYFSVSAVAGLVALNSRQVYRPPLLGFITITSTLAFRQLSIEFFDVESSHVLAMFFIFYISHMTTVLLFEKYRLPTDHTWDWRAAYKMLFNARWIGTERQVPDIVSPEPVWSATTIRDTKPGSRAHPLRRLKAALETPRIAFIRNRVVSFFILYTVNKIFMALPDNVFPKFFDPLQLEDFMPYQRTYLRRLSTVTLRETVLRCWILIHFVWSTHASLSMIHDVLAIIFVGSGIDEAADWPPLYGHIKDVYSVRRLWGKFWHKLVYRSYTTYGIFISSKILRLPKKSIVGRMFINFFVFFLSGCVHALVTLQMNYSCGWMEDILLYVSCFCAIVVEMIFQAAMKKLLGRYAAIAKMEVVYKSVGYLWVFAYLFWMIPKIQYPKMYCFPE